jgi:hypothetical protein
MPRVAWTIYKVFKPKMLVEVPHPALYSETQAWIIDENEFSTIRQAEDGLAAPAWILSLSDVAPQRWDRKPCLAKTKDNRSNKELTSV